MKPKAQLWRDYLKEGVLQLEGVSTRPCRKGKRKLIKAIQIFDECIQQREDFIVQVRASFRRLQAAVYQSDRTGVTEQLLEARRAYGIVSLSKYIDAQCKILEAVALVYMEGYANYCEAVRILELVLHTEKRDHKLLGDAANLLGRIYDAHGQEILPGADTRHIAVDLFIQAVNEFAQYSADPLAQHALAAASGNAGIALQESEGYDSPRAHALFCQAEIIFTSQVRDPCVRAKYWRRRSRIAFSYVKFPQAAMFFIWSLLPTISCWWQLHRK